MPKHSPVQAVSGSGPPLELVALSRIIATGQGRTFGETHLVCRVLALYARTGLVTSAGRIEPAPFADMPAGPWPAGDTALKHLGVSVDTIRADYQLRVHQAGPWAVLDEALIAEIIPRALWPVIARAAADGPQVFAQRAGRALQTFALGTVKANKRRAVGPPSEGSYLRCRRALVRVADVLVQLNGIVSGYADLESWTQVPSLPDPPATLGPGREVRAPRPETVRMAWAHWDREVREFLRIEPVDDLIEAIAALPDYRFLAGGLLGPLRRLLTIELFVLLGGRINAIRMLDRGDYLRETTGPPPDHRCGAALALRPGKTVPLVEIRRKPIPEETAHLIDAWLVFLARQRAAAFHAPANRECPRPPSPDLPANHPLLVGRLQHLRRWSEGGLRTLFTGQLAPRGKGSVRALIARESGWAPGLPVEMRPYVGHTPHEFRRLASQMAERAGEAWNHDHRSRGAQPDPEPAMYASALLDHAPPGDAMRNLYGDRHGEPLYELLCGRAIAYMRRMLTGPEGARRRPDRGRLEAVAGRLRLVDAELLRLHERADQLAHGDTDGYEVARLGPGPSEGVQSDRQLLEAIASEQRGSRELLLTRLEELRGQHEQYGRLLYEHSTLTSIRQELRGQLDALWNDETYWEVVPDDAPAGAELVDFTLADIIDDNWRRMEPETIPPPVRDWLLVIEFAAVTGVDRGTIARQLTGQCLPVRAIQRPWEAHAIPVDLSLGTNYRRIWIPGVKPELWRTELMRRRLAEALSKWPDLQGWTQDGIPTPRALAPLVLPPGFVAGGRQLPGGVLDAPLIAADSEAGRDG